jgi:DNA-binding beta-propeller fold protein YncE
MKQNILWGTFILLNTLSACSEAQTGQGSVQVAIKPKTDTITAMARQAPALKPYHNLVMLSSETLQAAPGTKSVLFNGKGSKLYALNLEGMSVYEFDQATRKVVREFKFKPTRGTGWDYDTDQPIKSYQEKPVEACFSHDDQILWVSLHNAEGIVPILVEDEAAMKSHWDDTDASIKKMTVIYPGTSKVDSVGVPLITTGKTPKVIAVSADSRYLLVSNWHSYSVSVLELNDKQFPYGKVIKDIPSGAIPRGVVVDDKRGKSYVAIMGGARINVIDNKNWTADTPVSVASNPRHIVMDNEGRLFVSYNKLSQIACVDPATGKTLFTAATGAQPRTIMLSKNKKFLFVTCYKGNTVDVFKINDSGFTKLYSLPCKGSPVGVDVYEDDEKLEAWVCNYTLGSIKVFTFKKE